MLSLRRILKRYRWIILILLLVACGLGFIVISSNQPRDPLASTNTVTATKRNVEATVFTDGVVSGIATREVYYPSQAKVLDAKVPVGARVKQGDTIAEIETLNSFGRKVTTEIEAPIDGLVTVRNYEDNQVVNTPTTPGYVIVNTNALRIEITVNENDVVDVKRGQAVRIVYPALGLNEDFSGSVENVDPAPLSTTGSVAYKAYIEIDERPSSLRLGMSADVEIITKKVNNVLAIPDSYIIDKEAGQYLKKVVREDNNKLSINEVKVEVGLRTDQYAEIKSGLSENEEIAEPTFQVRNGLGLFGGS